MHASSTVSSVCIFNAKDYVGPLFILYAALLFLWGLLSIITKLSPLLLRYILRQCCWYVASMFLVSSSVFSTLHCIFLMSASVGDRLLFSWCFQMVSGHKLSSNIMLLIYRTAPIFWVVKMLLNTVFQYCKGIFLLIKRR